MNIGNFLQTRHRFQFTKSVPRTHEERLVLHWKILIGLFFLGVSVLCVTSFSMYRDIDQGKFLLTDKNSPTRVGAVSDQTLSDVVTYFDTKSVTFTTLRKTPINSVDPSK